MSFSIDDPGPDGIQPLSLSFSIDDLGPDGMSTRPSSPEYDLTLVREKLSGKIMEMKDPEVIYIIFSCVTGCCLRHELHHGFPTGGSLSEI